MRVRTTIYDVPGWGTGTLWTDGKLVLAHDFDYRLDESAQVRMDDAEGCGASPARALRLGEPGRLAGSLESAGSRAAHHAARRAAHHAVSRAAPRMGGTRPPGVTLEESPSRVGNAFVAEAHRAAADTERRPPAGGPAAEIVARILAFFGGEDALGDESIDLSWCTPFQRDALAALRRVPRGEVVSYGELAALAGRPGAQRAVGTLCARNRFALLVPCHRVVAADGIGGYGSTGVDVKRRLLALEGVRL